jgi:PST family polysaccharide transporter
MLLGPPGIALTAIFTQIFEVGGAATGFGLGASGLRQIAAATATEDSVRMARVIKTLRRTVWCTGGLALLLMLIFAGTISEFTFESDAYRLPIMLLAIVIFVRALITSQSCILQGTRRIADGVKVSIGGAVAALVTYVPFAYFWKLDGIAPGILFATLINLGISWWYARKVQVAPIKHSWEHTRIEAKTLLAFGLPMMLTSLVGTFGPYFERVILLKTIGLKELGQYQAAYALNGVALGFILSAMMADYYPKLMAHLDQPARMTKEVNAQIEVSLLFAIPGATWMMAFAHFLISWLYTPEFLPAVAILMVTVFAIIARVVSWPLRLVLVARGHVGVLFLIEAGFALIGLFAAWFLSLKYGALGAGCAFVGTHIVFAFCMVMAAPRLLGVRISADNLIMTLSSIVIISLLLVNGWHSPSAAFRVSLDVVLASAATIICLRRLVRHTGWRLPNLRRNIPPSSPGSPGA